MFFPIAAEFIVQRQQNAREWLLKKYDMKSTMFWEKVFDDVSDFL